MNYCWQRHERKIAQRDFQSARRQPKFGRGARNGFETGAVGCGMTKLSNPWQTHLASEMPANHCQTGCTAVHLVDLQDVMDFADAPTAFAKQSGLVRERVFRFGLAGRLTIKLNFVVHLRFGRRSEERRVGKG